MLHDRKPIHVRQADIEDHRVKGFFPQDHERLTATLTP
jgi:hypothetical protein